MAAASAKKLKIEKVFKITGDVSELSAFEKRLKLYWLLGFMIYPGPPDGDDEADEYADRRKRLLVFHIAWELEKAMAKKASKRRVLAILTLFYSLDGFAELRRANAHRFLNTTKLRQIWAHWQFAYTCVDLNYRYASSPLGGGRTLSLNKTIWATIGLNDCRTFEIAGGRDPLIREAPRYAPVSHLIASALWIVGPEKAITLNKLRNALIAQFSTFIAGCNAAAPVADSLVKKRRESGSLFSIDNGQNAAAFSPRFETDLTADEKWILRAYDSTIHADISPTNPNVTRLKAARAKHLTETSPPSKSPGDGRTGGS